MVEVLSRPEIESRRARVLSQAGMSADELRALGEQYLLDDRLAALLDELDDLDFLLSK